MAPLHGYNVKKAAQVVAFFAIKEGGKINVLKTAKLVYLADRTYLQEFDSPILYDWLVSMPHGPANSLTLNYMNGYIEDHENWDCFISDRAGYNVGLSNSKLQVTELTELSSAEIDVLTKVWDRFGRMSPFELRDYTHKNCPEWEDPEGSSSPIPYERVLKYLGKDAEIANAIDEDRFLVNALS